MRLRASADWAESCISSLVIIFNPIGGEGSDRSRLQTASPAGLPGRPGLVLKVDPECSRPAECCERLRPVRIRARPGCPENNGLVSRLALNVYRTSALPA